MGGQNHQPTNRVTTSPSAWLSQKVGEGFIGVLEANNHLENAIMLGMQKVYVQDVTPDLKGPASLHLGNAITCLERSKNLISAIQGGFNRVLDAAASEGYTGNPLARKLPSLRLLPQFEGVLVQPHSNSAVWTELERRIADGNILETLRWERDQFSLLAQPMDDLIAVMLLCKSICESKGEKALVDTIENNESPLRQHYAQVFSLWNHLHAMFLYSALMMTELFYRANGYPSLLNFDPASKGVIAA